MNMTVDQVAENLRKEMVKLTDTDLVIFAKNMGVDTSGLERDEIMDACVALEQYAFTH